MLDDGRFDPAIARPPYGGAEAEKNARCVTVLSEFDALPFPAQSLDLVVLPHALELARDAHHTLREVERVLVPEGRVVVIGFNPTSLWGLRQRFGQLGSSWRLRDWLKLLSFEIDTGRFGCYRPALSSQKWLDRLAWMDKTGDRWWPVLGAVYMLVAVKRVRGMRLIGLARKKKVAVPAAPAVVANSQAPLHTLEQTLQDLAPLAQDPPSL
jgi:SAM-dependent methyltransferase